MQRIIFICRFHRCWDHFFSKRCFLHVFSQEPAAKLQNSSGLCSKSRTYDWRQVTPDLTTHFRWVWISLIDVAFFVPLAFGVNYLIFSSIGQYYPVTSISSAAPSGFMEFTKLGEERGCDIKTLTTQQFLRIIVVFVLFPTAISLCLVSNAGESIEANGTSLPAVTIIISFIAALGELYLSQSLRLPAS